MLVTFFKNQAARFKSEVDLSLEELRDLILNTTADKKEDLPWLKLAKFGDVRSPNGSLRYNANVKFISGVELDYDAGKMGIDEAIKKLKGIKCLIYTSPTHSIEKPKWRVLCPTSKNLPPPMREIMAARVNGACGGIFARESFVLSQAYYYGSVRKNQQHRIEIANG